MQRRQTNRWVYVPLLGLLGAVAGCSAPSQFVLELGADGGVVDVPLQFVPDRGLVDVQLADAGDAAPPTDGQVVDAEHVDVATVDAADGGVLDVQVPDVLVVDVALDAGVDAARPDVVDVPVVDDAQLDVVQLDVVVGDAGVDVAHEDRPEVDVPDAPPAPCLRNADCTGGEVCHVLTGPDRGRGSRCVSPGGLLPESSACIVGGVGMGDRCLSALCDSDDRCARMCQSDADCAGISPRDGGAVRCVGEFRVLWQDRMGTTVFRFCSP